MINGLYADTKMKAEKRVESRMMSFQWKTCSWAEHCDWLIDSKYFVRKRSLHNQHFNIGEIGLHGQLARWRKWKSCDVGAAKEGLENELWRRWSDWKFGEWATSPTSQLILILQALSLHLHHSLFSNPSLALPMSQLNLQPFHCFTYVTAHSPTFLSPLLRHRIFTYVTWRAAHESNP